jgi:hypothetical protein
MGMLLWVLSGTGVSLFRHLTCIKEAELFGGYKYFPQ